MKIIMLKVEDIDLINKNAKRALVNFISDAPSDLYAMYITTHISDITGIRFEKWYSKEWMDCPENDGSDGVINPNMVKIHNLVKKIIYFKDDSQQEGELIINELAKAIGTGWNKSKWILNNGTPAIKNMNPFGLDIISDILGFLFNKFIIDK